MKTISVTDLKRIPELSHLRMIDFINPQNDFLIAPYLKVLGFDLDYPIEYLARQHRNLAGEVVIAYMIAGEIECNASFLSSQFATTEDRIIVAGYKDMSLANELTNSLSTSREYDSGVTEAFPQELSNPDEQDIIEQINVLNGLIDQVRPNQRREDGSLKTLREYHAPPEPVKKERKRRSKLTAFSCAKAPDNTCQGYCGNEETCLTT